MKTRRRGRDAPTRHARTAVWLLAATLALAACDAGVRPEPGSTAQGRAEPTPVTVHLGPMAGLAGTWEGHWYPHWGRSSYITLVIGGTPERIDIAYCYARRCVASKELVEKTGYRHDKRLDQATLEGGVLRSTRKYRGDEQPFAFWRDGDGVRGEVRDSRGELLSRVKMRRVE